MTIILVIAIVATVACMVMLTYRINIVEKKTDTAIKMADNTDTYIQVKNLDAYTKNSVGVANVNFDSVASAIKQQRADIDNITDRLEEIIKDIARLDNEQAIDRRNLNDIRRRYVLYKPKDISDEDFKNRVNAVLTNGAGVSWAKEFPCNDEHE
jgi:hypothetical protein